MTDIQKLKALAEAATPGPWGADNSHHVGSINAADRHIGMASMYARRPNDITQNLANQDFIAAANPAAVLELIAEIERLQSFEVAYKQFSDKTDWVQETAHWSELGMHRADVLRKRVDAFKAENETLHKDAERYRWLRAETGSGPNIQVSEWIGPHEYRLYTEELDAAIDNALSEESSHG